MLTEESRHRVEKLLEDVRRYKARRNFPLITTDDFEWLAEKLLEEDAISNQLYEELQTANEELKHEINSRTKCPKHRLDMYYHRNSGTYACQNPQCKYAKGVTKEDMLKDANSLTMSMFLPTKKTEKCHCQGIVHSNTCPEWELPF